MPMTLVRRPQAVRRIHPLVMKDMRVMYNVLGKAAVATLREEISGWVHQPVFKFEVSVTKRKWRLTVKWDGRTVAGKIYKWVSEGTGSRGDDPAGETYFIYPKHANALVFGVPLVTATEADGGFIAPSAYWEEGTVITQKVTAPGIFPRHLGKDLYEHLKSRKSGSFHNVTEASIKRSFRKLGIYVG
ncbi:hypothetical protein LCGC14_0756500 [marine sediment metagenome]|uniref:Uncharacterized protein n=1 Tax=marine sediment metagenome TaxID=412755 RepID=A0A0F9T9E9_9ZZZZ